MQNAFKKYALMPSQQEILHYYKYQLVTNIKLMTNSKLIEILKLITSNE